MKKVVSCEGVEYEVVGDATMGADGDPVVVLRRTSDGGMEVVDKVVMGAKQFNADGTRTPVFREVG